MNALEEIRTPRLLLTRMSATDFEDLACMYRDPRVMATLGGVRSAAQTAQYLEQQLAHWEQHGFGWWAAREPLTGKFIGRGGLRLGTVDGRTEIEVGYGFLPEFWGRGLATELALESVRVGFAELHRPDLVSFTLPTNEDSRRVMIKAGFCYVRDIVHANLPHVLYRQTANAWRERGMGLYTC
jgi:ribosomal-protein-alanine N-acetyltransferase